MSDALPTETDQPGRRGRWAAVFIFAWLTAMGTVTLALAALVPVWTEYRQAIEVREQLRREVELLTRRVEKNEYYIQSYLSDPEAVEMLAVADLRFRRPEEVPLPLPSQVRSQIRPVGWQDDSRLQDDLELAPAGAASLQPNYLDRLAVRSHAALQSLMGRDRTAALVEAFCDPISRQALTFGALGVLAAALFVCRPAGAAAQADPESSTEAPADAD